MTLNIKPPRRTPGATEEERIRELEDWADQLTNQLNVILKSIGEENLSKKLREKISNKEA